MIILDDKNCVMSNRIVSGFKEDGVRFMGRSGAAHRVDIIDTKPSAKAHRDGFQIIPPSYHNPNEQFAGACTDFVSITDCTIFSKGSLQGIFSADGLIKNILISDCKVQTRSEHGITLNGLLNGLITRNTDENGYPVRTVLNNLRIGGGVANIWVKSFLNHEYGIVAGEHIIDNRGTEHHPMDTYLDNFDLDLFVSLSREITYVNTDKFCEDLGILACECV